MKINKTPYYSYKVGKLAKGCQLCVKGEKLVLFITGLCPRCCYFCPISDQKYQKDVIFADEWPTKNIKDIIQEAKLISAKGAGITGGDPLCKLSRTLSAIISLKKQFTKNFHIHLYTSLDLINKPTLQKLYNSGLDEIRFHLDLKDHNLWPKLKLALNYNWDVGIEIPAVPKHEGDIKKIILNINELNKNKTQIKFLNLNELEVADNKVNKLIELGYKTKDEYSYAIKGSEVLALKLFTFIERNKLKVNTHYCTAKLKDKVQLANRIKHRAKNIKRPYDKLTSEGTLIRGAIYLDKPSFGYRNNLAKILFNKKLRSNYLLRLNKIKNKIIKQYHISNELIEIDKSKLRILIKPSILRKIKEPYVKAIVEEYPTWDLLELNIEFLI